jgi:hypothetical protein
VKMGLVCCPEKSVRHYHSAQRKNPKREQIYRGVDKSLARPGRKQATATEDFDFHVAYL